MIHYLGLVPDAVSQFHCSALARIIHKRPLGTSRPRRLVIGAQNVLLADYQPVAQVGLAARIGPEPADEDVAVVMRRNDRLAPRVNYGS